MRAKICCCSSPAGNLLFSMPGKLKCCLYLLIQKSNLHSVWRISHIRDVQYSRVREFFPFPTIVPLWVFDSFIQCQYSAETSSYCGPSLPLSTLLLCGHRHLHCCQQALLKVCEIVKPPSRSSAGHLPTADILVK